MSSSGGSASLNTIQQRQYMNMNMTMTSSSFTDLLTNNGNGKEGVEQQQQQQQQGGGLMMMMNQAAKSSFSWGGMNSEHNKNKTSMDIVPPKYKSFPPASLPVSPPPLSPSSYLSFPPTLSPSVLLDSPVLFSSSNVSYFLPPLPLIFICYNFFLNNRVFISVCLFVCFFVGASISHHR